MPIEEIATKVRDRYARAASTGADVLSDQLRIAIRVSSAINEPWQKARTGSGFRLL